MVWLDLGLNSGLQDNWQTLYPLGQWPGWYNWCILTPANSATTLWVTWHNIYIYVYIYMCVCVCVCVCAGMCVGRHVCGHVCVLKQCIIGHQFFINAYLVKKEQRMYKSKQKFFYLSLIGIILRWGFLIWESIFIYCELFVLILVVFVLFLLSQRFSQISITWRRPEVKFGRNVVKEETTQKLPRWGQKVRNK